MSRRRAVVSGGTGYAGRFIVERLLRDGFAVTVLGRSPPLAGCFSRPVDFVPFSLGMPVPEGVFGDAGVFIHAAFDHLPGRYRGGEGDDPVGFRARNLDGSIALFRAARAAGVDRAVFLSSRAVYGEQPPGMMLEEATPCRPDTLYGEVKLETERRLLDMARPGFVPVVLRITGIYGPAGPGRPHKWDQLFRSFMAGVPIEPRVATEIHGDDVAAAVSLVLAQPADCVRGEIFNVADLVLDRHDLLAMVRDAAGCSSPLPPRADAGALNVMSTAKIERLGWRPGGRPLLEKTIRRLIADPTAPCAGQGNCR